MITIQRRHIPCAEGAVGKKYAVGDKKDDAPPEAKEKAVEPLHSRKNKMKKAL